MSKIEEAGKIRVNGGAKTVDIVGASRAFWSGRGKCRLCNMIFGDKYENSNYGRRQGYTNIHVVPDNSKAVDTHLYHRGG